MILFRCLDIFRCFLAVQSFWWCFLLSRYASHSFPKNIVADFGPSNGSSYGCRPYLMTKSVTIYFKHGFWRIVNSTARYTFDKTIFLYFSWKKIQAVFRNPARKPQIPVEALGLSLPPRLTDQSSFWVRFKSNTKRKDYLNTVCDPSLYCMYVVFKEIKKNLASSRDLQQAEGNRAHQPCLWHRSTSWHTSEFSENDSVFHNGKKL